MYGQIFWKDLYFVNGKVFFSFSVFMLDSDNKFTSATSEKIVFQTLSQ